MMDNKYALENLPISEETLKGLTIENINQLGAVGRMLSLQDLVHEDQTAKILSKLDSVITSIDLLSKRILKVEKILKNHETRIRCLEKRVESIEKLIA